MYKIQIKLWKRDSRICTSLSKRNFNHSRNHFHYFFHNLKWPQTSSRSFKGRWPPYPNWDFKISSRAMKRVSSTPTQSNLSPTKEKHVPSTSVTAQKNCKNQKVSKSQMINAVYICRPSENVTAHRSSVTIQADQFIEISLGTLTKRLTGSSRITWDPPPLYLSTTPPLTSSSLRRKTSKKKTPQKRKTWIVTIRPAKSANPGV